MATLPDDSERLKSMQIVQDIYSAPYRPEIRPPLHLIYADNHYRLTSARTGTGRMHFSAAASKPTRSALTYTQVSSNYLQQFFMKPNPPMYLLWRR
jgi:hypothetical protein